jgi:hypothetical protein
MGVIRLSLRYFGGYGGIAGDGGSPAVVVVQQCSQVVDGSFAGKVGGRLVCFVGFDRERRRISPRFPPVPREKAEIHAAQGAGSRWL